MYNYINNSYIIQGITFGAFNIIDSELSGRDSFSNATKALVPSSGDAAWRQMRFARDPDIDRQSDILLVGVAQLSTRV